MQARVENAKKRVSKLGSVGVTRDRAAIFTSGPLLMISPFFAQAREATDRAAKLRERAALLRQQGRASG